MFMFRLPAPVKHRLFYFSSAQLAPSGVGSGVPARLQSVPAPPLSYLQRLAAPFTAPVREGMALGKKGSGLARPVCRALNKPLSCPACGVFAYQLRSE